MKRYLLITGILLSHFGLSAQDWSIDINTSYLRVRDVNLERTVVDRYARLRTPVNYQLGVNVTRYYQKIEISSGLAFTNLSMRAVYQCDVCDFLVPPEPERIKLHYLTIPMQVGYLLLETDKLKLVPYLAANMHLPLAKTVGAFSLEETRNFYSLTTGTELRLPVKEHFQLGFTLSHQWALINPIDSEGAGLVNALTTPHDPDPWHSISVGVKGIFALP